MSGRCWCSHLSTWFQVEGQIESLLAQQQQLLARKEQLEQQLSADRRAPRVDWQGSFPWDADVQDNAEAVFNITSFRCLMCLPGDWLGKKADHSLEAKGVCFNALYLLVRLSLLHLEAPLMHARCSLCSACGLQKA